MYVIENVLKGKFNIKYNDNSNAFILNYLYNDKINYLVQKSYTNSEIDYAISKAIKVGECFEEMLLHQLKLEGKKIENNHKLQPKDEMTTFKKLKHYIRFDTEYDYPKWYEIYINLCTIFSIKKDKDIKKPYLIQKNEFGEDIINNLLNDNDYKNLKNKIMNILKEKSDVEIINTYKLFFHFNLEHLLFILIRNGDFKNFSAEYRNFVRSIQTFTNKICCPTFIHIPQKLNNLKIKTKNKYDLIDTFMKEEKQLIEFNNKEIIYEDEGKYSSQFQDIHNLKNEIILDTNENNYLINELNINLNPFIYVCFWLYQLVPISNKYITHNTGKKNIDKYIQEKLDYLFNKYPSTLDDLITILKEQVDGINNIIHKDNVYCNYTKLNEIYSKETTIKNKIENYEVNLSIYPNIALCIWDRFYNEYFLKKEFNNVNSIPYICIKCGKEILDKAHTIKDIANNTYHITPVLCDNCMAERKKESGRKRVEKFRLKNK